MQVLQTHAPFQNHIIPQNSGRLPSTNPQPLSASGMDAKELREFMAEYVSALADLTLNSKPMITSLTMLASENVKAASSIAAAIEKHILKCSATYKLYGLFLMDSIIKNVKQPYISLFSRNLPEVYMNVWNAAPQSRPTLQKLFNFWKGILPDQTLAIIAKRQTAQQGQPRTSQSMAAPAPASAQPQAQSVWLGAARLRAPVPQPQTASAAPLPPPPPALTAGYGVPAPAPAPFPAPPSPPSRPTSAGPYVPAVQQVFHPAQPAIAHYPPAVSSAQPYAPPQQFQPQPARQPSPQPQQPADAFPGFPQLPQLPGAAQPSSAVMAALRAALAQQKQAGSASAQQPAAASSSQDDYWADLEPEELPLKNVDKRKLDFDSDRLKAESAAVVRELMACTAALRPRHLDRMFLHRRRTRGAGRRVLSQQWYVRADDWVAGTAADAQAAPAFFDQPEKAAVKKEASSVPVDDAQPSCALSGERFETFWDDASEEWRYRDAVRLDAQEAARYGLHEGVIVKVTALSSGPDPFEMESEAAEAPMEDQSANEAAAVVPEASAPAAASTAAEQEPAAAPEVEPRAAVKAEPEAAAAAQEAAMEAADQVEGADVQAAAASMPVAAEVSAEASVQLPAGVKVKREPEAQLPRRRSKRLKQEL